MTINASVQGFLGTARRLGGVEEIGFLGRVRIMADRDITVGYGITRMTNIDCSVTSTLCDGLNQVRVMNSDSAAYYLREKDPRARKVFLANQSLVGILCLERERRVEHSVDSDANLHEYIAHRMTQDFCLSEPDGWPTTYSGIVEKVDRVISTAVQCNDLTWAALLYGLKMQIAICREIEHTQTSIHSVQSAELVASTIDRLLYRPDLTAVSDVVRAGRTDQQLYIVRFTRRLDSMRGDGVYDQITRMQEVNRRTQESVESTAADRIALINSDGSISAILHPRNRSLSRRRTTLG